MQELQIDLRADVKEIKRLYDISQKDLKTATSRAINRTIMHARTDARRAAKKFYNISALTFTGTVNGGQAVSKIQRSRGNKLQAELDVNHKPMSLTDFNPTYSFDTNTTSTVKRTRQGVTIIQKNLRTKSRLHGKGVIVTIRKGQRVSLPKFFMLPGKKVVFGRGNYKQVPSYGWVQRNHRLVGPKGNDSVTKILSASVRQTVVADKSQMVIASGVDVFFPNRWKQEMRFVLFGGTKPEDGSLS